MTKFQVTLKNLRANHACVSGYNKLVCALTGQKFDKKRETYIRYRHEEPISIEYILGANDLDDALWALRAVPNADRDCRHYAVWCARQVQHLMADERSITALDVAERHADGQATDDELKAAWDAAWKIARAAARAAAWEAAWEAAREAAWDAAWKIARAAARAAAREAAWEIARAAAWEAARAAAWAAARAAAREAAWDAAWKIARAAARAAAWVAARDAARAAAWSAALDAQADMLRKMCRGEALWQVAK